MSDESAAPSTALDPDTMAAMLAMDPGERWMVMLHGFAFLTFNRQSGPSGGEDFESQNHLMTAALHRLWGGKLSFFGTFSLEPATIPRAGAYELFQRGETYNGILLVDRQHPHDFFTELAAQWERPVSDRLTLRLYLAPVGEPALGPIAYPHRLSASAMPQAPLSHHNQDSTHITYDVITAAADAGAVALEGSVFHGAEPDEDRWNIQSGALDSYSGRLTVRPLRDVELQLSAGHLENPESIEPGNQTRYVGAVYYQRATPGGYVAVSLVSGLNETDDGREWGSLAEGTWKFGGANFVFGRVEAVDRDLYELTHKTQRPEGVPHVRTRVWAGTARTRARLRPDPERRDGHRRERDALSLHVASRRRLRLDAVRVPGVPADRVRLGRTRGASRSLRASTRRRAHSPAVTSRLSLDTSPSLGMECATHGRPGSHRRRDLRRHGGSGASTSRTRSCAPVTRRASTSSRTSTPSIAGRDASATTARCS